MIHIMSAHQLPYMWHQVLIALMDILKPAAIIICGHTPAVLTPICAAFGFLHTTERAVTKESTVYSLNI
jgi:hypothetical protein